MPPTRKYKHEPATAHMFVADTLRGKLSAALGYIYELVFIKYASLIRIEEITRWMFLQRIWRVGGYEFKTNGIYPQSELPVRIIDNEILELNTVVV